MNCMKCGRELENEQAFCDDCLLEMEKYPVKPGIAVQLPIRRETSAVRKTPKKRTVNPEEQISRLKKWIWFLTGALVVSIAVIIAMINPTVSYFIDNYHLRPGQNYNTVTPSTSPPETTEAVPVTETADPFEGMAE